MEFVILSYGIEGENFFFSALSIFLYILLVFIEQDIRNLPVAMNSRTSTVI